MEQDKFVINIGRQLGSGGEGRGEGGGGGVRNTSPHDPSNWREAFAKMLKQLKSYG